jgi:hypothetical protein
VEAGPPSCLDSLKPNESGKVLANDNQSKMINPTFSSEQCLHLYPAGKGFWEPGGASRHNMSNSPDDTLIAISPVFGRLFWSGRCGFEPHIKDAVEDESSVSAARLVTLGAAT